MVQPSTNISEKLNEIELNTTINQCVFICVNIKHVLFNNPNRISLSAILHDFLHLDALA